MAGAIWHLGDRISLAAGAYMDPVCEGSEHTIWVALRQRATNIVVVLAYRFVPVGGGHA